MKVKRLLLLLKKIFFIGIILASFILGIRLLISVFQSGYGYQFDSDELHHANLVYLYLHGYVPYRDIYNSFYTPLFEWLIAPAFMIFGFTFKTITFTRFIMIILLVIRMIAMYIFIKTVWSKRSALFFLPLFLLDPFLVFSGMQIRPDNFMMTVASIALAALAVGYVKQSNKWKYVSAFLFGLSLVIFMKVVPMLVAVAIPILFIEIREKKFRTLIGMTIAFLLPIVLFALYGLIVGALPEMIQQIIVETRAAYQVFEYPVPFGAYNKSDNAWIFGSMGTPVSLVYEWILPMLGAAGCFHVIHNLLTHKEKPIFGTLKAICCILLIVQEIVIFNVPSVFLQHYLMLNWLYALFGAVAFDAILTACNKNFAGFFITSCILFISFTVLTTKSISFNIGRGTIKNPAIIAESETRWSQIPENEPIFPGYLFRPSVYPVPYGYYIGNIPASVFARLPSIPDTLEKHQLKHLILDDYTMVRLPQNAQVYITSHYTRVPGDNELMTRNP